MTSEDRLPFLTERQLGHSQPDDVQTRVTFICVDWPSVDNEPFFGFGITYNLHLYLETCKAFEELSVVRG